MILRLAKKKNKKSRNVKYRTNKDQNFYDYWTQKLSITKNVT